MPHNWENEFIYGVEEGEVVKVSTEACYPPDADGSVVYSQRRYSYGKIDCWSYSENEILKKIKGGKVKALILVDIQNDFCEGGALAVPKANEIIDKVNDLQEEMKDSLIVATQDFHPQNHKSFASNNEGAKVGEMRELGGQPQVMWPDHCVQETEGSKFHKKLNMDRVEKIFPKGENTEIDSYSGFFDNDGKTSTGLSEYLKEKGVSEVVIVGLALDYCVKFTALDAVKEGFKTTLKLDMTRAVNLNEGDDSKAILELKEAGVICE